MNHPRSALHGGDSNKSVSKIRRLPLPGANNQRRLFEISQFALPDRPELFAETFQNQPRDALRVMVSAVNSPDGRLPARLFPKVFQGPGKPSPATPFRFAPAAPRCRNCQLHESPWCLVFAVGGQ